MAPPLAVIVAPTPLGEQRADRCTAERMFSMELA
jgi:hypothetical protein